MKKIFLLTLAGLAACSLTTGAATLGVGNPAPELKISQWVKGSPVTSLASNQTYVVEFWATWCGPCKASIPHLTELAHSYTNVTFIGVDVWEEGDDVSNTVTKFVTKMGDQMDYHVAMDTADNFMGEHWMKAAEQGGIPTAFLVQNGKILWIGHPMSDLEDTLKEVSSGKFDLEKSRKRAEAMEKFKSFVQKAMAGGDEAELLKDGKELEALDKEVGGILPNGEKFDLQEVMQQIKFQTAIRAYQKAVFTSDDTNEIAKLEAAAKAVVPKDIDFADIKKKIEAAAIRGKEMEKADDILKKYAEAVGEKGDKDKAVELAKQIEALNLKDPQILNGIAWFILTDESIKQRDLGLATRLAKAAVEATASKEAGVLDTYARALFDSGKITEAVDIEKQAVGLAKEEDEKNELSATLKKYQAAVPPAATNAPAK
jgi:thiol-disulfide isomerase/thioredoxin